MSQIDPAPHVLVHPRTRGDRLTAGLVALTISLVVLAAAAASSRAAKRHHGASVSKPTVVLVHGAFADASSWDAVISRLTSAGYPVIAPADPLRGPASDGAYIRSILATIKGPVILVGHSYGGGVITNAAVGAPTVKALVYIAAFAPAQGESQLDIAGRFPGALLGPSTLLIRPYALADGTSGADAYINPADFRNVFAQDVPAPTAALMAATQRPEAVAALSEKSGVPAWKTLPSWYMVARNDHAIAPAAERFMAKRAGSHTVEVSSSHAAMVSHPAAVAGLIVKAAQADG
jgi:pimeloyl-ACP methyl ester carboxylesterase